MKFGKIRF